MTAHIRIGCAASALAALALTAPVANATDGLGPPKFRPADKISAKQVAGSTVHGGCLGGGKITLTATPDDTGYTVAVTTRGLDEGTRWRGGLMVDDAENPDPIDGADFRRTADEGGWSVSKHLDATTTPYFTLVAFGPGKPFLGPMCTALLQPAKPFAGVGSCKGPLWLSVTSVQLKGGDPVVRWIAINAKPGSGWSITVTATDDESGAAEGSRLTANRHGFFRGKTTFEGMTNPKLSLTVVGDSGQQCTMRMARTLVVPPPAG